MKIICIANQKGGVAKTTTATTLVNGLTLSGKRALLIDMDPQCNASSTFRATIDGENTMHDVLHGKATLKESIQKTEVGDVVPCDPGLAGIEGSFTGDLRNYHILKNHRSELEEEYDYVIIDTPPSFGFYMTCALVAADGVVVPIRAEKYAVDGLGQILVNIESAKTINPNLKVYGVLLAAYDQRNEIDRSVKNQLPKISQELGFPVFKTPVRTCVKIKEAQSRQESLFTHYPDCNAAFDYAKVVRELVQMTEG